MLTPTGISSSWWTWNERRRFTSGGPMSTDGTLHWTYVNRGTDGRVYQLAWSRYLTAEAGD